jgi:hypothetical protein
MMKRTFFALALLFASTALAVSLKNLPATDHVRTVVEDIALEWNDGNISTGTSAASAAIISGTVPTSKAGWQTLASELFNAEFQKHTGEKLPPYSKLMIYSDSADEKYIARAAAAVAEGNAYDTSNPVTMKGIQEQTEEMVETLGHERDIHVLAVKTKVVEKSSGEKRIVRIHAFINVKSGKMVQIFTIEGTM